MSLLCYIINIFSLMAVVEFVEKLLSILKNEPETVQWINNGQEFQIINLQIFKEKVLPHYFRHSKFQSFIRQLNMYGFHKVNRRKNSFIFEHQNFIENQEHNYGQIKRTKKMKGDGKTKMHKSAELQIDTQLLSQKAPKMAELLNKLIEFNTKNNFDFRKLKSKLDQLAKKVSAKKERNLRPILKNIKQKIMMLDQIQRNISTINWNVLNNCQQESPAKTSYNQIQEPGKRGKKIKSAPVFMQDGENRLELPGNYELSLNNLVSFKSISSFIAFT